MATVVSAATISVDPGAGWVADSDAGSGEALDLAPRVFGAAQPLSLTRQHQDIFARRLSGQRGLVNAPGKNFKGDAGIAQDLSAAGVTALDARMIFGGFIGPMSFMGASLTYSRE